MKGLVTKWTLILLATLGMVALGACSSDDGGGETVTDTSTTPDIATGEDMQATPDIAMEEDLMAPEDTVEVPSGEPQVMVSFDPNSYELPEGVSVDDAGNIAVSIAGWGSIALLKTDGTSKTVIPLSDQQAAESYTLGLAARPGEIFAAVAAGGANPIPAPGIYKVTTDGTASLYATHPAMYFANDIELLGDTMLVSDSGGTIYSVEEGAAEVWNDNELLKGDKTACDGMGEFDIGVNGLAYDGESVYAAVTDKGIVLKYAASGGDPTVIVAACALAGADGIVADEDGSLIVAVNRSNKLVRIQQDGTFETMFEGPPLDFPASLAIREFEGKRQLLVTNASLISIAVPEMTAAPALVVLEL